MRPPGSSPLNLPAACALSAAAFVAYALALPGFDLPLAPVALWPLILALRGQAPRRAAGIAMAGGFVGMCLGFHWIFGMLRVFAGLPAAAALLATGLLCAYQTGRFGLWAWLSARATARGWPPSASLALGFAASELLYPLLFPWYLGATALELPGLAQAADLGGPILVGALVLLTNVAAAEVVLARLEGRRPHAWTLAWGLALPALAVGYGLARIAALDRRVAEAPAVRIGIVQGNVPLAARFDTIDRQLRLTREVLGRGAELVVWSESGVAGAFGESDLGQVQRRIGARLGVPAVVHATLRRTRADGGYTSFSASLLIDAQGRIAGRYDKQKPLMFGEYLPFGETFPVLHRWSPNSGHFVPGTSHAPLVWQGRPITVLICYEDILPSLVNRMVASAEPELLVNQTNDAWFLDSVEPRLHLGLSRFRAIEHRRFLVRATNTGVSAIVDPAGRVVLQGGSFREETLLGEVRFLRSRTVYEALGDVPWWIASALAVAAAFVERRRPTAAPPSAVDLGSRCV